MKENFGIGQIKWSGWNFVHQVGSVWDGVKTPKTLSIAFWNKKLGLCQSLNYLEWGLNVQNMLKLLDLYIIENTQMKIRR